MTQSRVRPQKNPHLKRLQRPQLTLVTRLSLGFGLVGLGVIGILIVSLLSMQRSSAGLDGLVSEALPVKETVADLQLTLKDISTGAAEHYNARDPGVLNDIRSRVEADISTFNDMVSSLVNDYPLVAQNPQLSALFTQSVDQAHRPFEQLAWNMNTHQRSIEAELRIQDVRQSLNDLRSKAAPVLDQYLNEMTAAEARVLAFRLQRLFDSAALLALNLSLADSLDVIEYLQTELRDNLDSVARLAFDIMDQQDADPAFADYYAAMEPLFEQLNGLVASNEGLIAQQKNLFVEIRNVLPDKIKEVQDSLASTGKAFQTFSNRVNDTVVDLSDEAMAQAAIGRDVVVSATALILALCFFISWLVVRGVRRPIRRLSQYMAQVGNGDFTAVVGHYARDEIGQIFQSTEQLVNNIRKMIADIAQLNQTINAISADTAESTEQVRIRLNDQSQDLNSIATATSEMSASVREVAQHTRQAAHEVAQSEQRAHDIEAAINASVESTRQLSSSMQTAVGVIEHLDAEVASIDQILDVIRKIADQTNLLALNAAIEAARAGEQGRGFAVVADEVRTLASRTQSSTEDIRSKIETIMTGSRNAVDSISTSVEGANELSERVNHVHDAFDDYLTYITRVNELNSQVSAATDEQQSVAEDITSRTQGINDRGDVVVGEFETTAERAIELKSIAHRLDQTINQIQL